MGLCVLCAKTYFSWLSGPRFLHMFSCSQYWAQTVLCIISEIVLSVPVVLYLQHGVRLLFIQSMQCVMRMGVKTSLLICTYTSYTYGAVKTFLTRLKYVAMWCEMAMTCKKGKPDRVDRLLCV